MKKLVMLLVLLLVPIAIGSDFSDLKVGEEIEDDGWHIKIIRVYEDRSVLIQAYLNPNKTITKQVDFEENKSFDGITINVSDSFYDPDPNYAFVDLSITVRWTNDCDEDSDCDDFGVCTIDRCIGYPLSCDHEDSHINITQCGADDGCCPPNCFSYEDIDCTKLICDEDKDCNDYNRSTNDTCNLGQNICKFIEIFECISGDAICPDNCTYTDKMLPNRDLDCSPDSECITHTDCDDKDASTADFCRAEPLSTHPKKCEYENITYVPEKKVSDDTPYKNKLKYIFNEPLKASKEQIEQVLKKQPYSKAMIITAFIVIAVALYYILVISKIKPDEGNVDPTSKNLKNP